MSSFTSDSTGARSHTGNIAGGIPLIQVSLYEHEQAQNTNHQRILPQLPSHKYRHTVWHELRSTQVTGDQLHAPRVREGPESKEAEFYHLKDDRDGQLIHHSLKGKEKERYRNKQESWENSKRVTLSYQKLNQAYQRENLKRILCRLKSAEEIILVDNSLQDLRGVSSFPKCVSINLSKNYISSFKDLPSMPQLRHLTISLNQIQSLTGLSSLPLLETLDMTGNGVYFSKSYRQRVFKILPNLKVLDGILHLESDDQEPEYEEPRSCLIM